MRQILLILLIPLLLIAPTEAQKKQASAPVPVALDPLLRKAEIYLTANFPAKKNAPELLKTLGFCDIEKASQSAIIIDDTWLSTIFVDRKKVGIFKLLGKASNTPFAAPSSTDIALQASLDLSHLPSLIRSINRANGTPDKAEVFLAKTIAGIEIETFLQSARPTIHFCVDFDESQEISLGKESIGRPHIAIRIDGSPKILEAAIEHFIATRNALFKKQVTASGKLYTFPAYFSHAIANYQPVISFDEIRGTTTFASSKSMLERVENSAKSLTTDPSFIKTWTQLPEKCSIKLYISKRALNGFHHFYKKALQENWTDNPAFLKNKYLITEAMSQLNSSKNGLAFALRSDEKSDTITLKIPFPSTMLLWILGQ